ncbi:hypothetical protein K458DRAFT_395566 [Lentithecium fluviatile CBS 122367]|uniref:Uncharacterized protein n=1 Tax=Lentithecium fluviatile CBS 122367 TaxID=1168545 RepID=A0A6G1II65_9PLEO|nr:hypothetical protein K458DRAFT_395566 [Lentithecium fluviatile CBS 122367]
MPAAERRAQLALYKDAALLPPAEVPLPEPSSSGGGGGGGTSTCGTSTCGFASTSRGWMQKHVN